MNQAKIRTNDIIDNTLFEKLLPGPCRVLGQCHITKVFWLIALISPKPIDQPRKNSYVKAPFKILTEELLDWLSNHRIHKLHPPVEQIAQFSEATIDGMPDKNKQKMAVKNISIRNSRMDIVQHILRKSTDSIEMHSAQELLSKPTILTARVLQATAIFKISKVTAYSLLHQYWAGGSQTNTLLPRYDRCGLPGQTKKSKNKLGRPSRAFMERTTDEPGYILTEEDRKKMKWGYGLTRTGRTLKDAYLITSGISWATHEITDSGKKIATLLPITERPSFAQFTYWGRKLSSLMVKEMLLPSHKLRQREARGGSVQDQVTMIGQRGCFDATSTDVYLCSVTSRLKKLPAMTRSIIKDIRSDVILGIYCGWDHPSPATALKTLLHAASDKVDYCGKFGVTIKSDDWPAMLPRTILVDNGELKGKTPSEAERQFGFGIEYTPAYRGDKKGSIESQNHADHKKFDHKLPGTTKGKQTERGEKHPAIYAIWNYYEYMAEMIRHVLDHNNNEEVPDLAPADMLLESPPIKLTRLNIFNWLRDRNMAADIPVNVESFRAFTLPDYPAVICKNGIYLIAKILGYNKRVPRLRYISADLIQSGLMAKVKQTGSPIKVQVKLDAEDFSQAWLVTSKGLMVLNCCAKDSTLRKMSLSEWLMVVADLDLRNDKSIGSRDQYDLDRVLRRDAITSNAELERKTAETDFGGKPSISSIKNNLRQNREEEIQLIVDLGRQLVEQENPSANINSTPQQTYETYTPQDLMEELMNDTDSIEHNNA